MRFWRKQRKEAEHGTDRRETFPISSNWIQDRNILYLGNYFSNSWLSQKAETNDWWQDIPSFLSCLFFWVSAERQIGYFISPIMFAFLIPREMLRGTKGWNCQVSVSTIVYQQPKIQKYDGMKHRKKAKQIWWSCPCLA